MRLWVYTYGLTHWRVFTYRHTHTECTLTDTHTHWVYTYGHTHWVYTYRHTHRVYLTDTHTEWTLDTYGGGATGSGGHVQLVPAPDGVEQAWVGERALLSARWGRGCHLLQFDGVGWPRRAAVTCIGRGRHTDVRGGAHRGQRGRGTAGLQPIKTHNTHLKCRLRVFTFNTKHPKIYTSFFNYYGHRQCYSKPSI